MKTLIVNLFLLQVLFVHAQIPDLHKVNIGMTKSQVAKLVGKPDKGEFFLVNKIGDTTETYWNYSPEQTIYFRKGKVSQIEFNKDAIRKRMKNSTGKEKRDTSK